MEIAATILGTILNSAYVLACTFFLLPRKKLKWWQIVISVALILLSYYVMAEEYRKGSYFLAAAIEAMVFILPVVVLCKGDPWRNVLIRLIFQMVVTAFHYVEYGIYHLFLMDIIDETWFDGLAKLSLKGEMFNALFTLLKIIPACLILRFIVKRWPEGHKKIYTVIVLVYLAVGVVSGIAKVKEYAFAGRYSVANLMLTIIPCVVLAVLVSAVYSSVEKKRLRRENEWYEERIRELENGLIDENDFHAYIKRRVDQLEEDHILVNCFGELNIRRASSELEMLLDRIFSWIRLSKPECAKVSFRGDKGMVMINVSFPQEEEREALEEETREIKYLAKKLGGTAVTDAKGLSAMAFESGVGGDEE